MIRPFTPTDLPSLDRLQPEGWKPIRPAFDLYLACGFCRVLAWEESGVVAGVANASRFGTSAWLSHVIVHPDWRRRGVASALLGELLNGLEAAGVVTVSLIATDLGRPVYEGLGFAAEAEYQFFEAPAAGSTAAAAGLPSPDAQGLRPASVADLAAVAILDRQASGEDRQELLTVCSAGAWVHEGAAGVDGFWLPALNEGLVVAATPAAGTALLSRRSAAASPVCLPVGNSMAAGWLASAGWTAGKRIVRMRRGPALAWRPDMVWSRAGGNFG